MKRNELVKILLNGIDIFFEGKKYSLTEPDYEAGIEVMEYDISQDMDHIWTDFLIALKETEVKKRNIYLAHHMMVELKDKYKNNDKVLEKLLEIKSLLYDLIMNYDLDD